MPRRVFSFDRPDRFICGTVGMPGQRTFFLQAAKGSRMVSVALEKAQVALLAERLASLLLALREGGLAIGDELPGGAAELAEPIVEQFRVGTLTLGWDADRERVVIEAREIGDEDEEEDDEDDEDDEEEVEAAEPGQVEPEAVVGPRAMLMAADLDDESGDVVRVQLEPRAALAFASGALAAVQAGRPPCPQCGEPLEATGHFCTRRNGFTH